MNGPMIVPMPEKLDKKALVEHANYLQDAIIQQGKVLNDVNSKLTEMCILSNTLANHLYALVDAFDGGDQMNLTSHLQELSNRRKSYKKPEVH